MVAKGGRKKQNDESDVHLPQPRKKSSYLLYLFLFFIGFFNRLFYRVFGRFVTRRVQKHDNNFFSKKSISAHYKKCGFFLRRVIFFLTLGCFARYFLSQPPKTALTHLRHFLVFSPTAPLAQGSRRGRKHQLEGSAVLRPWISIGHMFLVPTSPLLFFNAWVFCSKRGTERLLQNLFGGSPCQNNFTQNNSN
jgi:hypothetical protein